MAECVLDVVVAADHVRDVHRDIVDDVGEVKDRVAVGPNDHEVRQVLRFLLHLALDLVVERHVRSGHPEKDRLALAQAALVQLVGPTRGEQLFRRRKVCRRLGRLVERRLVIRQPEPVHRVEHRLHGLGRGACAVGVFDAEQKLSAFMPGEKPVINGCPHIPDVDLSCRAGSKSCTYRHKRRTVVMTATDHNGFFV